MDTSNAAEDRHAKPTSVQLSWMAMGVKQPGGKLPLFDGNGREIGRKTVEACIAKGWVTPWFSNPIKQDWLVCKLTEAGREVLLSEQG